MHQANWSPDHCVLVSCIKHKNGQQIADERGLIRALLSRLIVVRWVRSSPVATVRKSCSEGPPSSGDRSWPHGTMKRTGGMALRGQHSTIAPVLGMIDVPHLCRINATDDISFGWASISFELCFFSQSSYLSKQSIIASQRHYSFCMDGMSWRMGQISKCQI